MGWAARRNPTVRDGQTPLRVATPPSRMAGDDLAVFSPTRYTPTKPDGSPVRRAGRSAWR